MSLLSNYLKEEKGQSMVLIPILLIVLIGFAGLAIDGGRLYLAKSQLQKAVDAGVLAGADALLDDKEANNKTGFDYSIGRTKAQFIAESNYNNEKVVYAPDANIDSATKVSYVKLSGTEEVTLMLMPILGIDQDISVVSAVAKVNIGKIVQADKGAVIPIGINGNHLCTNLKNGNTFFDLVYDSGSGVKGNYNYLDFTSLPSAGSPVTTTPLALEDTNCAPAEDTEGGTSGAKGKDIGGGKDKNTGEVLTESPVDETIDTNGKGAQAVGYYIENGSPVPIIVGQEIKTQTGIATKSNNILPKIEKKIGQIIYVPIITEVGSGKSTVKVLGFAAFKLINLSDSKKTIYAEFIERVVPGEFGDVPLEYLPVLSKLVL
jgi:hypothetical protein